MNRITRGIGLFGAVNIGGGNSVTKVVKGTQSLNPASINNVTRGTVTFTLTGARSGDLIHMMPPAAFNDDLIFAGCDVTADDTVTVYIYNPTAAPIDDAAQTWKYVWIKF